MVVEIGGNGGGTRVSFVDLVCEDGYASGCVFVVEYSEGVLGIVTLPLGITNVSIKGLFGIKLISLPVGLK